MTTRRRQVGASGSHRRTASTLFSPVVLNAIAACVESVLLESQVAHRDRGLDQGGVDARDAGRVEADEEHVVAGHRVCARPRELERDQWIAVSGMTLRCTNRQPSAVRRRTSSYTAVAKMEGGAVALLTAMR